MKNILVDQYNDQVSIMNLNYSEHDEICFKQEEILQLASQLSNVLGINDLLKLRDHVELKIREIYDESKRDTNKVE